jgi:SAM-dependent methyltransferase
MRETSVERRKAVTLLFERLSPLYDALVCQFPELLGVEFGGSELDPGSCFVHGGKLVRHEDMQRLSFKAETFDLVVHSDVLEHIPDPYQGMMEIHRVLRPGGKCVFACPIYSVMDHRKRAEILEGNLIFLDGPCFHGDPLREHGVPVFYEFGLSLIHDLKRLGFRASYVLDHSLIKGYFSNNNPWQVGHMWPLVVVCEKVI